MAGGAPRIAEPTARGAEASVIMARTIVWRVFRDAALKAGDCVTAEELHDLIIAAEIELWTREFGGWPDP